VVNAGGEQMKVTVIAEIGINHNGDLDMAKKLIDVAAVAGCDYVKFQKREPEVCVPVHQRSKIRSTPWGEMTYLEYKKRIEFGRTEYDAISEHCQLRNIGWFASVWDQPSVDFMKQYKAIPGGKCIMKIPSALLTQTTLVQYARENCDLLLASTGMSTEDEIEKAVELGKPDVLFHTNSTYPSPIEELNLSYIQWLIEKYPEQTIGYSGHEFGLITTYAATMLGAQWIERHITLNRNLWGSDQLSSVEPDGLIKLIKGIRSLEKAVGTPGPRQILQSEWKKRKSLCPTNKSSANDPHLNLESAQVVNLK
jgi:N-acetylneuraminate synthase